MLIALTALLHVGFLVLEMFFWTNPQARVLFRMTPERAEATRVLAANQGSITGFSLRSSSGPSSSRTFKLKVFFLVCVVVAAIYGAWSVKPRILLAQGGPAILALLFLLPAS